MIANTSTKTFWFFLVNFNFFFFSFCSCCFSKIQSHKLILTGRMATPATKKSLKQCITTYSNLNNFSKNEVLSISQLLVMIVTFTQKCNPPDLSKNKRKIERHKTTKKMLKCFDIHHNLIWMFNKIFFFIIKQYLCSFIFSVTLQDTRISMAVG